MGDDDYPARLRAARGYAGLTQRELADRLGIERQTIIRREDGKGRPGPGEALAVARACGVPEAFMERGWDALLPSAEQIAADPELLAAAVSVRRRLTEAKRAADAARPAAPGHEDAPGHPGEGREGGAR